MLVIKDILPELDKTKIFTKVGCKDGCWQIKLTEESSLLTSFGRYKWNRMHFGISPASKYISFAYIKQLQALREHMQLRMTF